MNCRLLCQSDKVLGMLQETLQHNTFYSNLQGELLGTIRDSWIVSGVLLLVSTIGTIGTSSSGADKRALALGTTAAA